jgi:hypothetical protein
MITYLDIFHKRSKAYDNARTFVPTHQRNLSFEGPIPMKCM